MAKNVSQLLTKNYIREVSKHSPGYTNTHQKYDLKGSIKQNQRPPEGSHIFFEKKIYYCIGSCFIHWKDTGNVCGNPDRNPEFEKDPRAENKILGIFDRLIGNSPTDET
ncbi:hypothetical protein AYI69_g11091 [Smittium culicis]|uniref:Uncharacterized protein n=1 Tax=Smittium culicis TaxID=133412 RepID=A0A1R1X184_9FUNG|nr:hypothetical protein AYI69_g11091 [Smittium culicis]